MIRRIILSAAAVLAAALPAAAHEGHSHGHAIACDQPVLACATAVTASAAADGGLWLAFSAGGRVAVSRSGDDGASFAAPVVVSGPPATIDDGGEARPRLFAGRDGSLLVTWTVRQDKGYVGTVYLSRSADNGLHWSPPRPISSDPNSQRFETVAQASDGKLVVLWVDKRGGAAAKRAGQAYAGAGLAAAWSDDNGASFGPERMLADHSCECCRLGLAPLADGRLAMVWRHVFDGGVRDHAAAVLGPDGLGPIARVADDDWKVDGCPHHGPALAVDAAGRWQVAWFTDGRTRQGLFHAVSADGGRTFSTPRPLGNGDNQPSHPALLTQGDRVWLVWKEFDGSRTTIQGQVSEDGGAIWSAPRAIAATAGPSDHPQLISVGGRPKLSWLSRAEGWRLLPLELAP